MSHEIPFDPKAICDVCGTKGAYDFMGDLLCPRCAKKATHNEGTMSDETFGKWWRGLLFDAADCKDVAAMAWRNALAYLRDPQTAETCQHVPPHPQGYLTSGCHYEFPFTDTNSANSRFVSVVCAICQAVKQAGQEIASLKAERDQAQEQTARADAALREAAKNFSAMRDRCISLGYRLERAQAKVEKLERVREATKRELDEASCDSSEALDQALAAYEEMKP